MGPRVHWMEKVRPAKETQPPVERKHELRNEQQRKRQPRRQPLKETAAKAKAPRAKEKEKKMTVCAMKSEIKACAAKLTASSSTTIRILNAIKDRHPAALGEEDLGAEEADSEAAKEQSVRLRT